jgi:hypothetical protein
LLPRLERISVDSYWAHRATGVRGALTKILEQMETGAAVDPASLRTNLLIGFEILKEAAEEYSIEQSHPPESKTGASNGCSCFFYIYLSIN